MKIMIDAGHGPETAGKRSPDGRLREFHFNAATADEVKKRLILDGHTVFFSHQPDKDIALNERIRLANRLKADLFISIHANAFGTQFNSANGIETFIYNKSLSESYKLAQAVQRSLILATGRKDRGVKQADFAVLRETAMPAILIECGFMTNRNETELLLSSEYRKSCARAIVFGIGNFKLI